MANISTEVVTVTPDLASNWLSKARNAGKMDSRQIAAYAEDMKQGMWKLNGEPIIISDNDELLAGRLRLAACCSAQKSFNSLIIKGVSGSSFETLDALRRRQVSDIMSIKKEPHGRALAAGLAVLWRYSNGDIHNQSRKISAQALLAILENNPDLRTSIILTKGLAPIFPHGATAAMHFLFSCVDGAKSANFFAELSQSSVSETSVISLLKKQVETLAASGGRRNQPQLLGLMIKAWEAYNSGKQIAQLRYAPAIDRFPEISGLPANLDINGTKLKVQSKKSDASGPESPLKVSIEFITPQRATEILAQNEGNRSATRGVIDKYARDMKNGKWKLNGQTIKIGTSGRLLDGQHRLMAASRAGVGFEAVVVAGLNEAVFDTFDLGTKRSLSDILKDQGEQYTATLAASLRQLWLVENGFVQARTISPTVSELLNALNQHPEIRESVKWSGKIRDVIATSFGCALHYLFSRANPTLADKFMDRLSDGSNLSSDSPVLKLRNRLQNDRASRKHKMLDPEKIAITIKAWNAFYLDRRPGSLKWQSTGEKIESFPQIAGIASFDVREAA
jgi:hypothetical protein